MNYGSMPPSSAATSLQARRAADPTAGPHILLATSTMFRVELPQLSVKMKAWAAVWAQRVMSGPMAGVMLTSGGLRPDMSPCQTPGPIQLANELQQSRPSSTSNLAHCCKDTMHARVLSYVSFYVSSRLIAALAGRNANSDELSNRKVGHNFLVRGCDRGSKACQQLVHRWPWLDRSEASAHLYEASGHDSRCCCSKHPHTST